MVGLAPVSVGSHNGPSGELSLLCDIVSIVRISYFQFRWMGAFSIALRLRADHHRGAAAADDDDSFFDESRVDGSISLHVSGHSLIFW